jgi:hypothetical protein
VGDWPVSWGSHQKITALVDIANSNLISITKAGAIHTKGAWTELTASLVQEANGLIVNFRTYKRGSFDLAIGGAGSEIIVAANMLTGLGGLAAGTGYPWYSIPITIPAGTRLSGRVQLADLAASALMAVYALTGGFNLDPVLSNCATYGFVAASTKGTDIDPGATIHTKGAWVEFAASLTHPVKAVIVAFDHADATSNAYTTWLVDVGLGAAGSEQVLIPNIAIAYDTPRIIQALCTPVIRASIPAGSRVSLRAQCLINTVTTRVFDAVLYCFY